MYVCLFLIYQFPFNMQQFFGHAYLSSISYSCIFSSTLHCKDFLKVFSSFIYILHTKHTVVLMPVYIMMTGVMAAQKAMTTLVESGTTTWRDIMGYITWYH